MVVFNISDNGRDIIIGGIKMNRRVFAGVAIALMTLTTLIIWAPPTVVGENTNTIEYVLYPTLSDYTGGNWSEYTEYTQSGGTFTNTKSFRSIYVNDTGYIPTGASFRGKIAVQRSGAVGDADVRFAIRDDSVPGTWYAISPVFSTTSASWVDFEFPSIDFTDIIETNSIGSPFTIALQQRKVGAGDSECRLYETELKLTYTYTNLDDLYVSVQYMHVLQNQTFDDFDDRFTSYWTDFNTSLSNIEASINSTNASIHSKLDDYKDDILDVIDAETDEIDAYLSTLTVDVDVLGDMLDDMETNISSEFVLLYNYMNTIISALEVGLLSNMTDIVDPQFDNMRTSIENMESDLTAAIGLMEAVLERYEEVSTVESGETRLNILSTDAAYFSAEIVREKRFFFDEYSTMTFYSHDVGSVRRFSTFINRSREETEFEAGKILFTDLIVVGYDGSQMYILTDDEVKFKNDILSFHANDYGYDRVVVHISPSFFTKGDLWFESWNW